MMFKYVCTHIYLAIDRILTKVVRFQVTVSKNLTIKTKQLSVGCKLVEIMKVCVVAKPTLLV